MFQYSLKSLLFTTLLVMLALAGTPLNATCQGNNTSLNILVINDDGIGAVGIEAMQSALEAAGHNVVVVAPNGDSSGSSSKANFGEVYLIESADESDGSDRVKNEFKVLRITEGQVPLAVPVPATPIEVVVLSPAVTPFEPDIIISGINDGQNSGLLSFLSGTVAGASVSSTKFSPFGRRPAIAVSMVGTTSLLPPPPDFAQDFEEAAEFIVELISLLAENSYQGELLPKGIFLNVNYPAINNIKGVKLTAQGETVLIDSVAFPGPQSLRGFPLNPFNPSQFCDITVTGGLCVAGIVPVQNNETVKNADTEAVVNGYISITAFKADYAEDGAISDLNARLRSLLH